MNQIWRMIKFMVALFIIISISSYFMGITANWTMIGYFFAGMWALSYLLSTQKRHTQKIFGVTKEIIWYSGCFLTVFFLVIIFGENSLLGMYKDWSIYERSLWGFCRIFAPVIVLTITSVWMAYESNTKTFSKLILRLGLILSAVALMFHGQIQSLDRYTSVLKLRIVKKYDAKTINAIKDTNLYITVKNSKTYCYNEIQKNSEYKRREMLIYGQKYPVFRIEEKRKDGPQDLIRIWLPDVNNEFSGKSNKAWVRIREVRAINSPPPIKRKKVYRRRPQKTRAYGKGRYVFRLGKGEATDKIRFPAGNWDYTIRSINNSRFQVIYNDGEITENRETKKNKRFVVFYIKSQSKNAKIVLTIKKV